MKTRLLIIIIFNLLMVSCTEKHFISDAQYLAQVESDFRLKQEGFSDKEAFAIFDTTLTTREREALMFLYAYMPIGDITDYTGNFYLNNIQYSFLAQKEMPWGKDIPEEVFRHFVLPVRVNNENMDESRMVFYNELKHRIGNLTLSDAILEVNHWCHEKVIYTPSDARTSSPLASVKTAYGRCGEESTFTVAALRSVGIPARQVYTPRWAHTDDNHAWVEAWADGKWHFLGACEPEPVLNLGWFNAPASRGMLMHTKVFGRYKGTEEIMRETPNYTEINVVDNYAPCEKGTVLVIGKDGIPLKGAKVEFKIYNYAEYYTVATKYTDQSGIAELTAGKGDMMVWASKGNSYGFGKLSFATEAALVINIEHKMGDNYSQSLDIVPPSENNNMPEVTPEQRAWNDQRTTKEDSIRNAYTATFVTASQAGTFAHSYQIDSTRLARLLIASRGNYQTLKDFIVYAHKAGKTSLAVNLLEVISPKDLRDISTDVLHDHLNNYPAENIDSLTSIRYILNPRVANEMLTPYKAFFKKVIPEKEAKKFRANPESLVKWCANEIHINNDWNSQRIPISPAGVWKARMADTQSRNTFFVAVARSLGIPAWIDPVTGKTRYIDLKDSQRKKGKTVDVDFESNKQAVASTGILMADFNPTPSLSDPKYYTHFSISKYDKGSFFQLNYDEDGEVTWSTLLKNGTTLDEGYYMLVTGTRMANGSVLSNLSFFTIKAGETTRITLDMRENNNMIQVIGNFNSETLYRNTKEDVEKSILQTTGRGYFVIGILGSGQEPTNHAIRDIAALNKEFDKWGRPFVLLFPNEASYKKFNPQEFPELPKNIHYGIDTDANIQSMITQNMKLKNGSNLPIFIVADTFNRVVFVSQGYSIGLGEQLMKVIRGL